MKFPANRLQYLEGLDEDARAAFLQHHSSVIRVEADAEIAHEGDTPTHLHMILEGWACRCVNLHDGRRHIPALLLPGDVADLTMLATERLDYGLAALTPCLVGQFSLAGVRSALRTDGAMARALLSLALRDAILATRQNVVLARQNARERVAHLLCELTRRLAGDAETSAPRHDAFPLSQEQLGDVLGLSTVHINRVLQSLRGDGLIRVATRRIEVLDWNGLAAAGHFGATDQGSAAAN